MEKIFLEFDEASECSFEESVEDSGEIIAEETLTFEENLIEKGDSDDELYLCECDNYGCNCIAYEKCCGCLLQ